MTGRLDRLVSLFSSQAGLTASFFYQWGVAIPQEVGLYFFLEEKNTHLLRTPPLVPVVMVDTITTEYKGMQGGIYQNTFRIVTLH